MILKCCICGNEFKADEALRREDSTICFDALGCSWCKQCTEMFELTEHNVE